MNEIITIVFNDGEFHYRETYKYAHLVIEALEEIALPTEEYGLDKFKEVINIKIFAYDPPKRTIREAVESAIPCTEEIL